MIPQFLKTVSNSFPIISNCDSTKPFHQGYQNISESYEHLVKGFVKISNLKIIELFIETAQHDTFNKYDIIIHILCMRNYSFDKMP